MNRLVVSKASQDVLNLVFDGDLYFLPAAFNAYGGAAEFDGKPGIAHWTGRRKPWQMVLTDIDALWRKYNAWHHGRRLRMSCR